MDPRQKGLPRLLSPVLLVGAGALWATTALTNQALADPQARCAGGGWIYHLRETRRAGLRLQTKSTGSL